MISPTATSHSDEFPPKKPFEKDKLSYTLKIHTKNVILATQEKMTVNDTELNLN